MSVEAMAWAKRQHTGSMGGKSVLRALADYADEDGCCWPSQRQIARDCEMSISTVARHLVGLEAGGFFGRESRLRDNGSRSTDMIRLNFRKGAAEADSAPVPPRQIEGGVPPQIEGAPPSECGEPPRQIEGAHNYHPNHHLKKDSPQAPQGAEVGSFNSDGEGEKGEDAPDTQFEVFMVKYNADPTASEPKARRAWARLSATERAEALAMLPRYQDHCAAVKRKVCDPATYLSERRWKRLANVPAPAAKAEAAPARPVETDPVRRAVLWAINGTPDDRWVFIEQGSDAWRAWGAAFAASGFGGQWRVGKRGWVRDAEGRWVQTEHAGRSMPTRYPPSETADSTDPPDGAASDDEMAEFVGSGG